MDDEEAAKSMTMTTTMAVAMDMLAEAANATNGANATMPFCPLEEGDSPVDDQNFPCSERYYKKDACIAHIKREPHTFARLNSAEPSLKMWHK